MCFNSCNLKFVNHYVLHQIRGVGGTHYVRVMGRFRGIQPPFSRHWEKYRYLTPLYYQGAGENIDFRPLFHTFKGKCQL